MPVWCAARDSRIRFGTGCVAERLGRFQKRRGLGRLRPRMSRKKPANASTLKAFPRHRIPLVTEPNDWTTDMTAQKIRPQDIF